MEKNRNRACVCGVCVRACVFVYIQRLAQSTELDTDEQSTTQVGKQMNKVQPKLARFVGVRTPTLLLLLSSLLLLLLLLLLTNRHSIIVLVHLPNPRPPLPAPPLTL